MSGTDKLDDQHKPLAASTATQRVQPRHCALSHAQQRPSSADQQTGSFVIQYICIQSNVTENCPRPRPPLGHPHYSQEQSPPTRLTRPLPKPASPALAKQCSMTTAAPDDKDHSSTSSPNEQFYTPTTTRDSDSDPAGPLTYTSYTPAHEDAYLPAIRALISKDLSEPYSLYVYRYFLYQWGDLCFMALGKGTTTTTTSSDDKPTDKGKTPPDRIVTDAPLVGVIVCKLEPHRGGPLRGYIAMLAVNEAHRGQGIATALVRKAVDRMKERDADEIVLETEVSNVPSLKLYERLGFLRCKRLHRYYLNGNAAFRLVLPFREVAGSAVDDDDDADKKLGVGSDVRQDAAMEASKTVQNVAGVS